MDDTPQQLDDKISKFDKEDVYFIKFFYIYMNAKNEIEKVTEDAFELNDVNKITTTELCAIIERNKIHNGIKYNLLELLKYNATIEPKDVVSGDYVTPELVTINNIVNDIHFTPTIMFFQSLNCIYVMLKEKSDVVSTSRTRKRPLFLRRGKTVKAGVISGQLGA